MHTLIDAAFDRHRTVLMLLVFLIGSGIVAYVAIPKESEPDVPIPVIYVSMTHEGIAPTDAERLLIRPMETELRGLTGLERLSATASEGHASVLLEFDAGFDADEALADVREAVDTARSELPAATDEPVVEEVNVALFPVLNVALSGPIPERELLQISRRLQQRIEALPGVLEADVAGERDEVLDVIVDPLVLESYGVDLAEVIRLVSNNNLLVAAGAIDTGAGRQVLKVPGVVEDLDDVMRLPLKVGDEAVVRFGDVAELRRSFKDPEGFARIDGESALVLEITKRIGANIIDTVAGVRATVEAARGSLPPTLRIAYLNDTSEQTRTMLDDLQNNVISGVVLVVLVIMATLGIRSSLLVGLAIPGSFLTGILVLWWFGNTLNIVVLFSLILVVGMLVDGAIIVTELADRHRQAGLAPNEAWARAAKRMSWPIIASTFTTIAVFFPLLFWPGMIGQFMRYMPLTVITCLLASLAMALVFVPVLGKVLGERATSAAGDGATAAEGLEAALDRVDGDLEAGRSANAAAPFDTTGVPDSVRLLAEARGARHRYLVWLHRLLSRPALTLLAALGLTFASYLVYGTFGRGVEFFPAIEPETVAIQVQARGDLSIREQDDILRRAEAEVIGYPGIESVYTRVGSGDRDSGGADTIGTLSLALEPWNERESAETILGELRSRLAGIAGVRIETMANEGGPDGGSKPINIEVSAPDEDALDAAVETIRREMRALGRFTDISDDRPLPGIEWRVDVDRERAAAYGADIATVGEAIRLVSTGIRIAGYRPDDAIDELDIRLRYPMDARRLDTLAALRIPTPQGLMPASDFMTLAPAPRTGTLQRADGRRVVTIEADVADDALPDTELGRLADALAARTPGPGVDVRFAGEAEDQAEATRFLLGAFISAIFLMTIILVTQFNSLYQAALVLSAILFSTSGVLIGLLVTGQAFGIVMVGVGIIALAGIVVNNNIVLIDTFNRYRAAGIGAFDAAMLTGAVRLRPVCLTAITTVLGLMPMVLALSIDLPDRTVSVGAPSTQWWTQLASAIAGGLAFTTLLTLLLTPCLLVLGAQWHEGERGRLRRWIRPALSPPAERVEA